jgi:hypothetical protein
MKLRATIDTGALSPGWAFWDVTETRVAESLVGPVAVGLYQPKRTLEWYQKTRDVNAALAAQFLGKERAGHRIVEAWIEYPQYFDSEGGQIAAKEGNLVKLAVSAGKISELCEQHSMRVRFVGVNEWKGQLNKEQTEYHVRKRLGDALCERMGFRKDIWDAVGIGLFAKNQWIFK